MAYNSSYTGAQIDAAVGAVRGKESVWDGYSTIHTLTHQGIQQGGQYLTGLDGATGLVSCCFKSSNPYTTSYPNFIIDGVTYTPKLQNGETPDSDLFAANAVVSCVVDTNAKTVNFKSGGGLSNSRLALATATAADVAEGKTFYAGDETLKTGTRDPGYIYKIKEGTAVATIGSTIVIDVGLRPEYIMIYWDGSSRSASVVYDVSGGKGLAVSTAGVSGAPSDLIRAVGDTSFSFYVSTNYMMGSDREINYYVFGK